MASNLSQAVVTGAVDAQSVGNRFDALCSVSSAPITIEAERLVVAEV